MGRSFPGDPFSDAEDRLPNPVSGDANGDRERKAPVQTTGASGIGGALRGQAGRAEAMGNYRIPDG